MNDYLDIKLKCSTCSNAEFTTMDESIDISSISGNDKIKCNNCGLITTKNDLAKHNIEAVNNNPELIKNNVVDLIKNEFKQFFK